MRQAGQIARSLDYAAIERIAEGLAALRERGGRTGWAGLVAWLAGGAMLLALVGNLYPVPEGPYGKLPYLYVGYLVAGLAWFFVSERTKPAALVPE